MEHANKEGIDLFKMAIIALLVCLVVSAGAMLFDRVYTWLMHDVSNMKSTTNKVTLDKYLEFEDISASAENGSGNYPLITMVTQTILESDSPDVLFYQVFLPDGTYQAYSSADLTSVSVAGATVTLTPEEDTATFLMNYAGRRCALTVYGDDDGFDYPSGMYSIIIQIK